MTPTIKGPALTELERLNNAVDLLREKWLSSIIDNVDGILAELESIHSRGPDRANGNSAELQKAVKAIGLGNGSRQAGRILSAKKVLDRGILSVDELRQWLRMGVTLSFFGEAMDFTIEPIGRKKLLEFLNSSRGVVELREFKRNATMKKLKK